MPRKMNTPSPPAPVAAAIVATPTAVTVATRNPAIRLGRARGSCRCHSTWRGRSPRARPASSNPGGTCRSPVIKLRNKGNRA